MCIYRYLAAQNRLTELVRRQEVSHNITTDRQKDLSNLKSSDLCYLLNQSISSNELKVSLLL